MSAPKLRARITMGCSSYRRSAASRRSVDAFTVTRILPGPEPYSVITGPRAKHSGSHVHYVSKVRCSDCEKDTKCKCCTNRAAKKVTPGVLRDTRR